MATGRQRCEAFAVLISGGPSCEPPGGRLICCSSPRRATESMTRRRLGAYCVGLPGLRKRCIGSPGPDGPGNHSVSPLGFCILGGWTLIRHPPGNAVTRSEKDHRATVRHWIAGTSRVCVTTAGGSRLRRRGCGRCGTWLPAGRRRRPRARTATALNSRPPSSDSAVPASP